LSGLLSGYGKRLFFNNMKKDKNYALEMARSYAKGLSDGIKKLEKLSDKKREELEEELFYSCGVDVQKVYSITLAGGGPAMRISGELDEHNQPTTARLEYQDWFTPWTEFTGIEENLLLEVANHHYFGEINL
jgi:hypothetical protein